MYFTKFLKYILFYTADAFVILAWCIVLALIAALLSWLIRSAWAGLKLAALDILQLVASYRSQQLDLIERKVRIALTAAPYLDEVRELHVVLAELEQNRAQDEPVLAAAFGVIRRIKSLPKTAAVAHLRERARKVVIGSDDP